MKQALLTGLLFIAVFNFSFSQTNTFPASGNVGIGTTSPVATLDVNGNIGVPSGGIFGRTDLNNYNNNTQYYYFGLERSASVSRFNGMKVYNVANVFGSPASRIGFYTDYTGLYPSTEWMTINEYGNVGINTTSPANKLDVEGGSANISNTSGQTSLIVGSGLSGYTYLQFYTSTAQNGYGIIQSISSAGSTYGNTVVNPNGGNVLIGQTSQHNTAYLVDVAGSVRSNTVVVNSTGADFVFAPKYKLAPLSFLEKYINQNHHLPEIPSAKQMQANGLDVGKNETKLLQKVEELTLYLIEKDKKEKEQEDINIEQQKKLKAQQAEIDELNKKVNLLMSRTAPKNS